MTAGGNLVSNVFSWIIPPARLLLFSPRSSLIVPRFSLIVQRSSLLNYLAPEVRGDVGDVYPSSVAFPDELGEAYLPLLVQLLYEAEQSVVVSLVARNEVGSAAQEVVAVLRSTHKCIELLAAVA